MKYINISIKEVKAIASMSKKKRVKNRNIYAMNVFQKKEKFLLLFLLKNFAVAFFSTKKARYRRPELVSSCMFCPSAPAVHTI